MLVLLERLQPDHVLRRLGADAHLIPVVLVANGDTVQAGPDKAAQDGSGPGDLPVLVAVTARLHDPHLASAPFRPYSRRCSRISGVMGSDRASTSGSGSRMPSVR